MEDNFREIFERYSTIGVYGMSGNESKAANRIPAFLMNEGYNIIPINPRGGEILGLRCYESLSRVEESIDILNVFRPSEDCVAVVEEAVERRRERGDISLIWLQLGITNIEARAIAEGAGIPYVEDRCIFLEFGAAFAQ